MAAHEYHAGMDGYEAGQLLVDGCPECEARSAEPLYALLLMDPARFEEAWHRALAWDRDELGRISRAEQPVLEAVVKIALLLERRGLKRGDLPTFA